MDYLQNITFMNALLFLAFGFVVGMVIHFIDSGNVRGGIIGTILFGIAGSIVGGFLSTMLFGIGYFGFSTQGILTAIFGGLVLAFVYRLLFRDSGHFKTTVTHLQ